MYVKINYIKIIKINYENKLCKNMWEILILRH